MTSATREDSSVVPARELAAWGHLLVAIALLNVGNLLLDDVAKAAGIGLRLFLSPVFIASMACLGVAFLFYVKALSRLPLAVAYPVMVGVSMIVVAVANHYWHEPLSLIQLAGVLLLFAGVVLISTSPRAP